MKIPQLHIALFLACIVSSCQTTLQVNTNEESVEAPSAIRPQSTSDSKTFYEKYFRLVMPDGKIRFVERFFYGDREDLTQVYRDIQEDRELDISLFTKFSKASFYAPDAISLSESFRSAARETFAPLIDSIFNSAGKSGSLHAEVAVVGYCDETPMQTNSAGFDELLYRAQKDHLDTAEYRRYVSYFRAKDLGNILSEMVHERKLELRIHRQVIIDFIIEGRSVNLPEIGRSYAPIDPKRRIAKVYWRIIRS